MSLAEVPAERRASVALDAIHASRQQWAREHRRPPSMSAREALQAVQFECSLLWVCVGNLMAGEELTDEDWERMTVAMNYIDRVCAEVIR